MLADPKSVLQIAFEQREMFISPCADVGGQGAIIAPEIRARWAITMAA